MREEKRGLIDRIDLKCRTKGSLCCWLIEIKLNEISSLIFPVSISTMQRAVRFQSGKKGQSNKIKIINQSLSLSLWDHKQRNRSSISSVSLHEQILFFLNNRNTSLFSLYLVLSYINMRMRKNLKYYKVKQDFNARLFFFFREVTNNEFQSATTTTKIS